MIDGILIIDKPVGITSHDVVARCRRILKTKRIGHTGTLDPFATGVMVILVGKATRLAQFLDRDAKEYEANVRFGFETDTGDRTGSPKAEVPGSGSEVPGSEFQVPSPESRVESRESEVSRSRAFSNEEIENALKDFRGEIMQTPPMYSAKKVDGKKLYELARKGIEIEREPVKINIYALEMIESRVASRESRELSEPPAVAGGLNAAAIQSKKEKDPGHETLDLELETLDLGLKNSGLENLEPGTWNLELKVVCSAGTYIRVLAEEIGKKLKIGAHLAALRRTRAGKFGIERAVTLEKLEEIVAEDRLGEVLGSLNEAVAHLTEIKLTDAEVLKIKNGVKLKCASVALKDGEILRLTAGAELLAIGFYAAAEKNIQPKLVLV